MHRLSIAIAPCLHRRTSFELCTSANSIGYTVITLSQPESLDTISTTGCKNTSKPIDTCHWYPLISSYFLYIHQHVSNKQSPHALPRSSQNRCRRGRGESERIGHRYVDNKQNISSNNITKKRKALPKHIHLSHSLLLPLAFPHWLLPRPHSLPLLKISHTTITPN